MNGVEPQTAFEGYIKGNIEELRREMREMKATVTALEERIIEMVNQTTLSRGKMIGWGSAFGVMGGIGAAIIRALWR